MGACKGRQRIALIAAVLVSVLALGGCATYNKDASIKYSYDAKASFSERKSYTWSPSSYMYRKDPLLEANVRDLADQLLARKGYTRTSEKPDLTLSMSYEFEIGNSDDMYRVRTLSLNIHKIEGMELVWRGTAFGTIKTDAASGELNQTVQGILSNFPPN
jgi:Domain of unknown function (DUF4136)